MENSNTQAKNQMKKVFNAFFESPKTMLEVDAETNIERANICRYVGTLKLENRIALIGFRKCKVTGHNHVGTYTTNPEMFPKSNQYKMF